MRMYDIIETKRTRKKISKDQIDFFIKGYINGEVPDYQASALLMAICFADMEYEEIFYLTKSMINSGEILDLSPIQGTMLDKHSTGGVGDKTTLIVLSIVASLGFKCAKMSGRGLGHTGGTIDKVESIPGFKTNLSEREFLKLVDVVGFSIISQSKNLAIADKKLYELRDVTATVNSIPLIASSIMSKKIASGADCITLDVKFGNGAFMKTKESAEKLAKIMVKIAKDFGKKASALITNMNKPLGKSIGNSLEIIEIINMLNGKGSSDLKEICIELSSNMLYLAGFSDLQTCREASKEALFSGKALKKFKEAIKAQGGDTSFVDDTEKFKKTQFSFDIISKKSGIVKSIQTQNVGNAAVILGAGRKTKTDKIDHSAGIVLEKNVGNSVKKGEKIATLFSNNKNSFKICEEIILNSIDFKEGKILDEKLIFKIIN